jgi:hypothetical protein
MGDSGIAGLWLRLALVLIVAMLVGVGSVLLANRTLPKPVAEGHNSTLSPFLTCVALVYGPLLGFTVVVATLRVPAALGQGEGVLGAETCYLLVR